VAAAGAGSGADGKVSLTEGKDGAAGGDGAKKKGCCA
jgi:hypothetical protein